MGKRLSGLGMHNQDRRDLIVEEYTGDTRGTVCDVETNFVILLLAFGEVTAKLGGAVLVGVDL
jgi:hypothetical protein